VALVSERHLREAQGDRLVRIARDSYSYLHLSMIAGIVLIALGIKKTIGDVDAHLETVPVVALFGGGHDLYKLVTPACAAPPTLSAWVALSRFAAGRV
jgi:low temperature requirement protein LtrA